MPQSEQEILNTFAELKHPIKFENSSNLQKCNMTPGYESIEKEMIRKKLKFSPLFVTKMNSRESKEMEGWRSSKK